MRDSCQRFHRGPHHEKSQELAPELVEASSLPNVAHGMRSGLQHTHSPRSPERPDKRANQPAEDSCAYYCTSELP